MTASNLIGRVLVLPLVNKSGGGVILGDVVVIDTANAGAFTTTTSAASVAIVGVAQETIANNATGRVMLEGYTSLVNVNASVTLGHYGQTHTVAKQAADAGASRQAGTFCQFLSAGTTPDAMLWPTDLGGGTGAPTTADYLTGTAQGGLSAEIVVGTSPGGELGGTWASPTVDATHSGSKHNVPISFYRRTAGDYSLNNNSTFAAIDATNLNLTVAAATGDVLEIALTSRFDAAAVNAFLDVATIVAASPVNYVSGGTGANTDFGIAGWLGLSGVATPLGGPVWYTVQAGDLSGGNVTVRAMYRTSAAATKGLKAGTAANDALFFAVKNLRQ